MFLTAGVQKKRACLISVTRLYVCYSKGQHPAGIYLPHGRGKWHKAGQRSKKNYPIMSS